MVTSVFITLTSSTTPEAKRAIIRKTTAGVYLHNGSNNNTMP